jgi:UDP-GlcNAc:undecaprenyl-phosphate GlcNAc-1-phosphate transferase
MDWICFTETFIVFILGWSINAAILPRISLVSFRRRLFDQVNPRKIHTAPIPRLGGIAFFPCIVVSVSLVVVCNCIYIGKNILNMDIATHLLSLFCSLFILYLMGMMDDLIGVRYRSKFLIQLFSSILLALSGLCFDSFYGLFGIYAIPKWIGLPLTVLIIVFIMNAINLIDGIDGLASGLSIIAFLAFGCMFSVLRWWMYAFLAFSALGVLIPFFYYNVFGQVCRGRKIFMGDTGSLTIGLLLAVMAIRLSMVNEAKDTTFPGAIVISFSFLIVPMLDVVRVIIHRLRTRKNPFLPDKNHIHHKFMKLGMPQHQAMISIVSIAAIFAVVNVLSIPYVSTTALFLIDVLVWTVMHILITMRINKRERDFQRE